MSIWTARGSASTLPLKVNTPGLNSKCNGVIACWKRSPPPQM
ncbi:MAG: hypothetical protein V7L22_15350 [Nostoc sp.]